MLWLISLVYAMRVFTPETYQTSLQSPDMARDMIQKMVAYKHGQLRRAQRALLVGFILMAVNIVVYLGCMPAVTS